MLFGNMKKILLTVFVCAALSYVLILIISTVVFYAPWSVLQNIEEQKRNELISLGVFSPRTHPLYKDSLYQFLRQPNEKHKTKYFGDTYAPYGVKHAVAIDDEDNDFLGFPNVIAPHEASILFVGDSFGVGTSAGSKLSPAAIYSKITGSKVYNSSNGAWGPVQYVGVIKMMTRELPKEERFIGKDVVVLFYLGNDFNFDMLQYKVRQLHTDHVVSWLLHLGPLRKWINFIQLAHVAPHTSASTLGQQTQTADNIPAGMYAPIPMRCETVGHLPFAWHPSYAGLLRPEFDVGLWDAVDKVTGELKSLESEGLRIKVVIIPANIQVLADDIDWASVSSDNKIARDTQKIKAMLEEEREKSKEIFKKYNFDVLDVTDAMRSSPQRCLYYQPFDTHCTALGYEAIGKAIAAKWPDLGKF